MQIEIANASTQNLIFIALFLAVLCISAKKFNNNHSFTPALTEELKGFSILAIIFSHIGYFLVTDNRFLYPLSTIAGVGVNLFLFLSGLGLTISTLKSERYSSPLKFYLKRLPKLFLPMWIVLTVFLIMDYFILERSFQMKLIIQNYLGFFPWADLFKSVNSPLWYFSMILFYYLIFPLIFHKKITYIAPLALLIIPYLMLKQELPIVIDVINLYKVHLVSFPLGVLFALIIQDENLALLRFHFKNIFLRSNLKFLLIPLFIGVFAYTSINSGVGEEKKIEQTISLITMFSIIFIFIAKNYRLKILSLFGNYSYEIYLLHWPLLAQYDFFYRFLPASVASAFYLIYFLVLAYCLRKFTGLTALIRFKSNKIS